MRSVLIMTFVITLAVACNNAGNNSTTKHDEPKSHADSLLKDVMAGHDIAMAKMMRLPAAQKKVQLALDSINTLPEKLKKASANYVITLDTLSANLKYAEDVMNKWMAEFNYDSATKGPNVTMYLESENQKISNVKESLFSALQKTDSLFKK